IDALLSEKPYRAPSKLKAKGFLASLAPHLKLAEALSTNDDLDGPVRQVDQTRARRWHLRHAQVLVSNGPMKQSTDLEAIASKSVLFTQSVTPSYLKKWSQIGSAELSGEVARPVVRFTQNIVDFTKCKIYDSAGMVKEARPEECIGLERSAAWEPHH